MVDNKCVFAARFGDLLYQVHKFQVVWRLHVLPVLFLGISASSHKSKTCMRGRFDWCNGFTSAKAKGKNP